MEKLTTMKDNEIIDTFADETPIGARSTFINEVINQIVPTTKNELILLEVIKLMESHLDIVSRATGEVEDQLAERYEIYVGDYYQAINQEGE